MKVLSLFSGIGAFEKALENLGIETDLVGYCEIDKYAAKSYSAIHNVSEEKNLGDITKIDAKALPRDIDLITYGFPCQDISIAGKQKGLINEDGTQTRSGLFFEALRIIEETKPKVAIAENVKNLVGKKFNAQFQVVLASLEAAGYNNYWSVLNAKGFGVPQNRERVFIVSIRKDIDRGLFQFPVPIDLSKRLKDVLEEVVDEKYYLDGKYEGIVGVNENYAVLEGGTIGKMHDISRRVYNTEYVSPCLHTSGGGNQEPKVAVCIGGIGEKKSNGGTQWYQQDRIYQGDIALAHPSQIPGGSYRYVVEEPTIKRVDIPQVVKVRKYMVNTEKLVKVLRGQKQKSGWTNKVLAEELELPITTVEHYFRTDGCFAIPEPEVWGKLKHLLEMDNINEFDESIMTFEEREGVFEKSERHYLSDGIAPTLTSTTAAEKVVTPSLRIRKLTPKECFRLMGFDDESFHKAEAVNSNSQLYKQAGNSIVVNVLEAIFRQMLDENGNFTI